MSKNEYSYQPQQQPYEQPYQQPNQQPYQQNTGYGYGNMQQQQYQPAPYTMSSPIKVVPNNISDVEKGQTGANNQNMGTSDNSLSNSQWGDISNAFSDKTIRIGFIRKVYLLLSVQLLFTFGVVLIFVLVKPVKEFAKSDTGLYFYIVSYCIFLFLMIFSICMIKQLRKVPFNYIFLTAITLSMTYMLGMISAYHDIDAVLIAVGITMLITIGVTAFAMQTKYDFTQNCMLVAVCLCFALIGFGIACIFVHNNIMQAVYGGLGAIVMALFLAIDTQLILGNKRYAFNPEDYVIATLQLYLDICQIFLYLLTLLGSKK